MQVVKRDGSIEEFNVDKIISAVEKAFKSCNKKMPQYLYDMLGALFGTLEGDTIGIEEIQNKVEDVISFIESNISRQDSLGKELII